MSKRVTFEVVTKVVVDVDDAVPSNFGALEAEVQEFGIVTPEWNGTTLAPGQTIGASGIMTVVGAISKGVRCVEVV